MASRRRDELPEDVEEFLSSFQALMKYQPGGWDWIGRQVQMRHLEELDLNIKSAEGVIADELTDEHHVRGPEPDDHCPGDGIVNIFRYPMPGSVDVYIKIGLRLTRSRSGQIRGVIWSFKRWDSYRADGDS